MRPDGRSPDELRPLRLTRGFLPTAEGSCLIEVGRTRVICSVSIEEKVPAWRRGQGGWLTAEYAMLPRATQQRTVREVNRGRPAGRSQEIQRLIGRALRQSVDLQALGERTLWVDCDVLEADGGTRTAAITGAQVALVDALCWLRAKGLPVGRPLLRTLSAVSCGVVDGAMLLDLCYAEDARAEVDANVVVTDRDDFVELQATAEGAPLPQERLLELLRLARKGAEELREAQRLALGPSLGEVLRDA